MLSADRQIRTIYHVILRVVLGCHDRHLPDLLSKSWVGAGENPVTASRDPSQALYFVQGDTQFYRYLLISKSNFLWVSAGMTSARVINAVARVCSQSQSRSCFKLRARIRMASCARAVFLFNVWITISTVTGASLTCQTS